MPIAAVRSGRPTERLNEEEEIEERSQVFFFFFNVDSSEMVVKLKIVAVFIFHEPNSLLFRKFVF